MYDRALRISTYGRPLVEVSFLRHCIRLSDVSDPLFKFLVFPMESARGLTNTRQEMWQLVTR